MLVLSHGALTEHETCNECLVRAVLSACNFHHQPLSLSLYANSHAHRIRTMYVGIDTAFVSPATVRLIQTRGQYGMINLLSAEYPAEYLGARWRVSFQEGNTRDT